MRTVTFQSVLNGVAILLGMTPSRDLNAQRAASICEYVNQRVLEGWRWDFWPEWTVVEQRFYREKYDATRNVGAGEERYFVASGKYYQALQGQTPAAQAPATLVSGAYVENSAWWAESLQVYQGNDWATGTVFSVGNRTRNPADGNFYQCFSAHTAGATFDGTKFGVLKGFDRYIGYEQTQAGTALTPMDEVKGVYRRSPRVYPNNAGALQFAPSDNGVQVVTINAPASVWVEFRVRPPQYSVTGYSATGNVNVGDLRYWSTSAVNGTGEVYQALQPQSPAVQDPSNASFWKRVVVPAALASWLKRAGFADGLKDSGQTDRATEELEEAREELAEACDRALAGQGQFERAAVQTYGT